MCCISFLQGHYPRMRMPTRCMPAVTFQAEIPSKKANPLWTACVKISFFFFFKSLTDVLAPWHKDPAMSQHYKQTRTWQQRGVRPTPHRENSNGNFTLESLFCRTQNWNTPLRPLPWTFFFFYKLSHNPWAADQNHEVSLAVRFLTGTKSGEISSSKECGKRSSIYGYYSTINWS